MRSQSRHGVWIALAILGVAIAVGVFLFVRPSPRSSGDSSWTSPEAILEQLRAEARREAHPARDHGRVHVTFVDAARRPLTQVAGCVVVEGEIHRERSLL